MTWSQSDVKDGEAHLTVAAAAAGVGKYRAAKQRCARAVMRARIILLADARLDNLSIAQQVGVDDHCVSKWRSRWASQSERLASAEAQSSDQELMTGGSG